MHVFDCGQTKVIYTSIHICTLMIHHFIFNNNKRQWQQRKKPVASDCSRDAPLYFICTFYQLYIFCVAFTRSIHTYTKYVCNAKSHLAHLVLEYKISRKRAAKTKGGESLHIIIIIIIISRQAKWLYTTQWIEFELANVPHAVIEKWCSRCSFTSICIFMAWPPHSACLHAMQHATFSRCFARKQQQQQP